MARRLNQFTTRRLACLASSSSRCRFYIAVTIVVFVVVVFFDLLSARMIRAQSFLSDGGEDIIARGCVVGKGQL